MRRVQCACALQLWPHRKHWSLPNQDKCHHMRHPLQGGYTGYLVSPDNKPPPQWVDTGWCHCLLRTQESQRLWENTQVQHPDRLNSWTGWNHLGRTIQRETIIQQPGVSAWGWSNLRTNTVSDLLDDPRQEYNQQGSATCRLAECEDQKLTDQRSWTFQKPLRRRNFDLSVALRSNRYL